MNTATEVSANAAPLQVDNNHVFVAQAFAMAARVYCDDSLPDAKDVVIRNAKVGNSYSCEIRIGYVVVKGLVSHASPRYASVRVLQALGSKRGLPFPHSIHDYHDVTRKYEMMRKGV